eukprot:3692610-Pleurochrysis_carterae.AAC.1
MFKPGRSNYSHVESSPAQKERANGGSKAVKGLFTFALCARVAFLAPSSLPSAQSLASRIIACTCSSAVASVTYVFQVGSG